MKRIVTFFLALLVPAAGLLSAPGAAEKRLLTLDDLYAFRDVTDPQMSPDGNWVAYSVRRADKKRDKNDTDIYMTSWDGKRTVRLTSSPASEDTPRFSPDGASIAFLSSRSYKEDTDQVWLMSREGGEAERITDLKGGVSDYAFSPDGKRLVVVADDPDPDDLDDSSASKDEGTDEDDAAAKTAKPIVIDRFQFKDDETGYLKNLHSHLYLVDVATHKTEILTPGRYDEDSPAWSPDGKSIVFVTKHGEDPDRHDNSDLWVIEALPGSKPRQLTTSEEPDGDSSFEGGPPAWSPDGKTVAYLHGGPAKMLYYAGFHLFAIPAAGRAPREMLPGLDRNMTHARYTADGSALLFILEDDGNDHLARVPAGGGKLERLLGGRRTVSGFSLGPQGRIAVLAGGPDAPSEVYALENGALRGLSRQNDALLSTLRMSPMEETSFKSKDGTEIHGFMVKPPDYSAGKKYPTILRIHGGPVSQFENEFMFEWQILAAGGYVVVGVNPRGSSGRGEEFAKAIYADWGGKDSLDVLAAVDDAIARGIADPDRLGIGGWSYGGILTDQVIFRDQRFKAATSGAGMGNVLAGYGTDEYIREYENELGTPWGSLDAYLRNSAPFLHADKITTPTLFLCGEDDFNVPLLNSEQMYQALKSLGRDTQLVIYPDEHHGLKSPSNRVDRLQRYLAWYGKYLK